MESQTETLKTDSVNKQEAETSTEQKNEISSIVEDMVSAVDEVIDVVINHVTYSPPDSTGEQYIIDKTTTTINKQSNKSEQKSTAKNDTIAATINTNKNVMTDRLITTESNSYEQTERKAAILWWQAALIFLGGATVIYIGYKIYKKKLP